MDRIVEIVEELEAMPDFQMPAQQRLIMYIAATAVAWGARELTCKAYRRGYKIYKLKHAAT